MHDDEEHVRAEDWDGDVDLERLIEIENDLKRDDEQHVRGQDWDGEDEIAADLLHDDDEHIRGQDWDGDVDVNQMIEIENEQKHDDESL